ncbi:hypothetical protein ACU4GD_14735 [Cupriavidus basilensis]
MRALVWWWTSTRPASMPWDSRTWLASFRCPTGGEELFVRYGARAAALDIVFPEAQERRLAESALCCEWHGIIAWCSSCEAFCDFCAVGVEVRSAFTLRHGTPRRK